MASLLLRLACLPLISYPGLLCLAGPTLAMLDVLFAGCQMTHTFSDMGVSQLPLPMLR